VRTEGKENVKVIVFLLSVIESCCQKAKTKQILKITKCETNGTTNHLFETNPEAQNKI
jgi:hypothetical protein